MSFGESVYSVEFIQKTIKADLYVRINHAYLPRNGHQKVPEDSRGHHTEAGAEGLPGGASVQVARPLGPPVSLCLVRSFLHRLLDCIYAVLYVGLIQGLTMEALAYIYQPLSPSLSRSLKP